MLNASSTTFASPPPSRHDNPFATCWTRPGALAYRFADGEDANTVIDRLAAQNWQGAIVGPHGSGKSTLLEALKPELAARNRSVLAISLRDGQRRLPPDFWKALAADDFAQPRGSKSDLIIIDGYEQLGLIERLRIARRCRRAGAGLLITSHTETRFPTLLRLAPNTQLITRLVGDLNDRVSTPITFHEIAASHACHGSNVREIFFDLYDRHERQRRLSRTNVTAAP